MISYLKVAVIACLALAFVIVVFYGVVYSCPIKHSNLLNELKKYHEARDPELCEELDDKIMELNRSCGIEEELIDCG